MRLSYRHGERLHEVEVSPLGEGRYTVAIDGVELHLTVRKNGETLELGDHHGVVRVWVTADRDRRFVTAPGFGDVRLDRIDPRSLGRGARGDLPSDLASPMPGRVVKVLAAPGDEVKQGQTLLVVEAMKTELAILAPRDGRVARVAAAPGTMCEAGKPLVELEES
jgi:biotin carboxyl carrier protein